MGFSEKLLSAAEKHRSWLCIGLDPDPPSLPYPLQARFDDPLEAIYEFNRKIIEATCDLVCAYKPNIAFYEALGPEGLELLRQTLRLIPKGIPIILDAKRGDVAHSAVKYARAAFEVYGCDAITLSPYLGWDSIEPFLHPDRGVFLLCRTSNPGARDLQDLDCGGRPLYGVVATYANEWAARARREGKGEIGLVVGGTYPEELKRVREIVGDEMVLLVPGIGAQGGDLDRALKAAANSSGERAIIAVSRGVLYASRGEDFAEAARREAQRLHDQIQRACAS